MLCHEALKVNENHKGGQIYLLKCKRWSCPLCAPENAARVKRLARKGQPDKFLTLTWKVREGYTPDEAARIMVDAWRILVKRIKKKWPRRTFEYFRVFEKTEAGWPHLHILLRSPFISQKWLSAQWEELTGAFVVDIREVKSVGHAAWYIAKYIGKDLHNFKGVTRYHRSRQYCQRSKDADTPLRFGSHWSTLYLSPQRYMRGVRASIVAKEGTVIRWEPGEALVWQWPWERAEHERRWKLRQQPAPKRDRFRKACGWA